MRKHFVSGLILLLVLAVAAFAGDKANTKDYHRMHGDIASLDATAQTFTVKHDKEISTFKTDSSTKYKGLGKTIAFGDLQVGDDVRVSYTENGADKTAARVDVAHHAKKG
jgi:hypothetical protein